MHARVHVCITAEGLCHSLDGKLSTPLHAQHSIELAPITGKVRVLSNHMYDVPVTQHMHATVGRGTGPVVASHLAEFTHAAVHDELQPSC